MTAREIHIDGRPVSLSRQNVGEGAFGEVYLYKIQDGDISYEVAIKYPKFNENYKISEETWSEQLQEIATLKALQRVPGVIGFHGTIPLGAGQHAIMMEPIARTWGINLTRETEIPQGFQEAEEIQAIIDWSTSLEILHLGNRVHYDLHLRNFGLNSKNRGFLIDFGKSLEVTKDRLPPTTLGGSYRSKDQYDINGPKISYKSEETIGNPFAEDVFALGVSLARQRMNLSQKDFLDCYIADYLIDGDKVIQRISQDISNPEVALIHRMLGPAAKRPTMSEVTQTYRDIYKTQTGHEAAFPV